MIPLATNISRASNNFYNIPNNVFFFRTKHGRRSKEADAAASKSEQVVTSSQGVSLILLFLQYGIIFQLAVPTLI